MHQATHIIRPEHQTSNSREDLLAFCDMRVYDSKAVITLNNVAGELNVSLYLPMLFLADPRISLGCDVFLPMFNILLTLCIYFRIIL